jgi:MOSC domain-containing protein YiiM
MTTEPTRNEPAQAARLVSIQVGMPRDFGREGTPDPLDAPWRSAIVKGPVSGPIRLGHEGLAGDGHADGSNHGGPDKAVLAYGAEHYDRWRAELGLADLAPGGFGENLTIAGVDEAGVALGDLIAIGPARLRVTQPRLPCWKLARRWRLEDLPARVKATGRSGWYLRVVEEGTIEPGLEVVVLERPCPEWTIERVARLRSERAERRVEAAELAACPYLADSWRRTFAAAAAEG